MNLKSLTRLLTNSKLIKKHMRYRMKQRKRRKRRKRMSVHQSLSR
jgi:hypothetical protein